MLNKHIVLTIFCGLLLTRCAVIKDSPNKDLVKLGITDIKKLNGQFSNHPTSVERKIEREMSESTSYTLLTLWDQITNFKYVDDKEKAQLVTLEFVSNRKAVAKLWDNGKVKETRVIKGKIKDGYFYRRPHFIAIPLVPLVFGYDTYRYRIGLATDAIVIDYKWNYWGFAIAAGSFSKGQTSSRYDKK
jgi:hypothetical protein